MECKCKVDLPYPEVTERRVNKYEVSLLMPAYGGRNSETTAIMGYIYQSYILAPEYPEIAHCLEEIGITEMKHHDLLGTAIVNMGGTPYIGGNNGYWQGSYVNYIKVPHIIINNNIMGERNAIAHYREIIRKTHIDEIKEMIERIILDEEVHVSTLEKIKKEYF